MSLAGFFVNKKPKNFSTQTELIRIVRVQKLHYNHEATSYRLDDWIIAG